jgi:ribose transport system permease protein
MRPGLAALRRRPFALALALVVILLVLNVIAAPQIANPGRWPALLATLAPFILVGLASTPSVLSGGIDVSIGPLVTFINCLFVAVLVPAGLGTIGASVPIVLLVGLAAGLANGLLVAVVRLHPVVATTGTLFIFVGGALVIAPRPAAIQDSWTAALAGTVGGFPGALLLLIPVAVLWLVLRRTAYVRNLLAVGDDELSAFGSGVPVVWVRVIAYALGGLIASLAGLALTALVQSSEPSLSTVYALIGLAAVVLGGTPLGGGRGGMVGTALGATAIFLLQELLTAWGVQSNLIQLMYGVVLLLGVIVGATVLSQNRRTA